MLLVLYSESTVRGAHSDLRNGILNANDVMSATEGNTESQDPGGTCDWRRRFKERCRDFKDAQPEEKTSNGLKKCAKWDPKAADMYSPRPPALCPCLFSPWLHYLMIFDIALHSPI